MAKAQDEELLATLVKMREGLKSHHIPMTAADITDLVEAVDDLDSMLSEMKLMFMQMTYKIEKVQNILMDVFTKKVNDVANESGLLDEYANKITELKEGINNDRMQERVERLPLFRERVAGTAQYHIETVGAQMLLDVSDRLRVKRVTHVGAEDGGGMGGAEAEPPRQRIGQKALLLHNAHHLFPRLRADIGGVVHHARHGGDGNAAFGGNVVDVDACHLLCKPLHCQYTVLLRKNQAFFRIFHTKSQKSIDL